MTTIPNWNQLIAPLPGAHILQSSQWGEVKRPLGWQPMHVIWYRSPGEEIHLWTPSLPNAKHPTPHPKAVSAAALILYRSLSLPQAIGRLSVAYVPKGPLLNWGNSELRKLVLSDLKKLTRKKGAIHLKIDPDVRLGTGIPGTTNAEEDSIGQEVQSELLVDGWHFSPEQIQFKNTVHLDLTLPEEDLLAQMKQKTRYNIRLATRKGVQVRMGSESDIQLLYKMYAETAVRDEFIIRDIDYYARLWTTYMHAGPPKIPEDPARPLAEPLIAEVDHEPIAAVIIFRFAKKAWFLFGMSRSLHRQKMPNHLLQWEAIRHAKAAGCEIYDMWGAPDEFQESDSLWGVFRFKQGFQGRVVRQIGAWDYPHRRTLYRLYTQTLPQLLHLMRRRGRTQLQKMERRDL